MGDFKLNLKLSGLKELEKQLKNLADPRTAKKIQRRAATAAIRPMRKACKAACPVGDPAEDDSSGSLKKSIDSKVTSKGTRVGAIVGADTSVNESGEKVKLPNEGPRAARHLHLVLFGHVADDGKAVPGNNFLQRGYEASASQCQRIYEEKLADGIEKAAEGK